MKHFPLEDQIKLSRKICLDFDGVIHKYGDGWHDGEIYDEPVEGAIEGIKKLQQFGFDLVILTAKSPLGERRNSFIRKWLKEHGIENIEVTNIKPTATVYIDDRGIRFTNWCDILRLFT